MSVFAAALSSALAAGCREQEQIATRTEPHMARELAPEPEPPKPPADLKPGRLIGALLPQGDSTWFFKILGPDAAVAKQSPAVKEFLTKIRIEADKPKYDLPKGWRERPGDSNRFVTLLLDEETPPTELAISRFPGGQDLAENISRWRGQVNLPKLSPEETTKLAQTITTAAGPATWVELVGTYSPSTSAMPPFAGGMGGAGPLRGVGPLAPGAQMPADHPPIGGANGAGAPAAAQTDPRLKYDVPSDWRVGAPSAFVIAAFSIADGSEQLRVTVSEARGSMLDNINRWRVQELQMPPIDEDQMKAAETKLKVDGREAYYVELIGPANPGPQQATFAVVVPQASGMNWFFKMKGDAPLAQRRREQFSKFVSSIRFVE